MSGIGLVGELEIICPEFAVGHVAALFFERFGARHCDLEIALGRWPAGTQFQRPAVTRNGLFVKPLHDQRIAMIERTVRGVHRCKQGGSLLEFTRTKERDAAPGGIGEKPVSLRIVALVEGTIASLVCSEQATLLLCHAIEQGHQHGSEWQ